MIQNISRPKRFCKECGKQKFFQSFCLWCFKDTGSNIHVVLSDTISIRDAFRLRKSKAGVRKFLIEIISGWFPTKGELGKKLSHGVVKLRVVDRETNEYHEVIKEYRTKKVIHECHELLSKHKK
jgi:hypothetical protein